MTEAEDRAIDGIVARIFALGTRVATTAIVAGISCQVMLHAYRLGLDLSLIGVGLFILLPVIVVLTMSALYLRRGRSFLAAMSIGVLLIVCLGSLLSMVAAR